MKQNRAAAVPCVHSLGGRVATVGGMDRVVVVDGGGGVAKPGADGSRGSDKRWSPWSCWGSGGGQV